MASRSVGVVVLVVASSLPATHVAADALQGAVKVGQSQAYTVVFDSLRPRAGEVHLKVAVSQAEEPVRRIFLRVRPSSGTATFKGREYPIAAELAARWWAQLAQPSVAASLGTAIRPVAGGIPGKLNVTVSGDRLRELRFFSLEEWNNSFGEYVSLGLSLSHDSPGRVP